MKKGRHRRYEEARALKRSSDGDDIESLMERLDDDPFDLPTTPEATRLPPHGRPETSATWTAQTTQAQAALSDTKGKTESEGPWA